MKLADLLTAVGHPSLTAETPVHPVQKEAAATDQTIAELFRAQVRAAPDGFAVNGPDSRWTYSQLDRQSDRLAFILRQHGVQPEGAVALIMTRSPCVVVAMLAVLKAGAAYVPILPTDPVERIQHIVRATRSRVLISENSLQELIQSVLQIIPECAAILVARDSHGRPEAVEGENGDRADGPESIRFLTCDTLNEVVDPPAKRASPASLAYVMYTSGTSGRPKGVMIEQRNIVQLIIHAGYIEIRPSDRILQAGSLAFDAATFEIWGALLNGASVYIAPKDALLRSDALKKLIQCEQITILFLTTALFNQLTDESSDVFEGIRVLLTGGECVSASHMMRVRRRYPHLELLHVYGPTENTTFTTAFRVEGDFELDVPIGRPIGGDVVSVLGADLKPQPAGVPGELCTGGCGLARGYLNDAALTAEKFIPDPAGNGRRIYRTGDLACWNREHGLEPVLEFRGRVDDQVKVRGFRVEPAEIEARLREINGVRDAAVIVRNLARIGKSMVAYLAGDAELDTQVVREFCKKALPDYMVPGDFVVLDCFPLNANGKIDRSALPLPAPKTAFGNGSGSSPADSTLVHLRAIWAEVLGRTDFGEEDDFFDLGGHSLLAVQMVCFIEERMRVEIPIDAIFDAPTLRGLTQYLLDSARFGAATLDDGMVLMSGDPACGAIFAFPPATADCLGYSDLARSLDPRAFYGFTFLESEDRIARYAELIQNSPATEPYCLFGYSSGGNLAYHVAGALEARRKVVALVVMLDSARHLAPLNIPFEKVRQVADDFLSSDGARKYLTSAVLRDKAFRNITRNVEYVSQCIDAHMVKADIHLIASENSEEVHSGDDGRIVLSKPAWETATAGRFLRYRGAGGHDYMLHQPHFTENAALIRAIVERRAMPITSPPGRSCNADRGPAQSFAGEPGLEVFDRLESRVRSYCRSFPKVFQRAEGAWLYDREGKGYIDFLCGAGSLNYGHNPPALKRALVNYIEADGVAHALDLATGAKERFLLELESTILRPRQLDYRVQFVSPSGANGIEASLKLARKIKRRHTVVAFTNGYHGLSSGALSVTADAFYRGEDYTQRSNVAFMPFDGYFDGRNDTLDYFERCLLDRGSGLDRPAAVIVETVQAEGGINVARSEWLQGLARLCERFDMLLIVDDIQVGCGRTGTFFSFEPAGLYPDIVVLSKSISGFGLPMSLVLLKPALDAWKPGEHTGTFRGNNLAFVTATAALEFWRDGEMPRAVSERSAILKEELTRIADTYPELHADVRGIGLIFGLQIEPPALAQSIVKECFARGVIAELCGPRRNVLKFLPPLVIEPEVLCEGLRRIRDGIEAALSDAVS